MIYLEHYARNKCVQIFTGGPNITVVRGFIGEPSMPRQHDFGNVDDANAWVSKRIHALGRRGYRPGRQNPQLIDDIANHIDDDGPRLVYGDWLQEQHDSRGELIALQAAKLRGVVVDPGHESTLLSKQRKQWLGDWADSSEIEWHLGFAKSIIYSDDVLDSMQTLANIRRLLTHPTSRFLEVLTLRLPLPPSRSWHARELAEHLPTAVDAALQRRGGSPKPALRVIVEASEIIPFVTPAAQASLFTIESRKKP